MTNQDAKLIALRWLLPWSKWGALDDAEADGHSSRINGAGAHAVPRAWRSLPALRAAWLRGWDEQDFAMEEANAEQRREQQKGQEPGDE